MAQRVLGARAFLPAEACPGGARRKGMSALQARLRTAVHQPPCPLLSCCSFSHSLLEELCPAPAVPPEHTPGLPSFLPRRRINPHEHRVPIRLPSHEPSPPDRGSASRSTLEWGRVLRVIDPRSGRFGPRPCSATSGAVRHADVQSGRGRPRSERFMVTMRSHKAVPAPHNPPRPWPRPAPTCRPARPRAAGRPRCRSDPVRHLRVRPHRAAHPRR
jgi:hypothetical protein